MNCWSILGIEPTTDRNKIRDAYMDKLNLYHPEDDPEGFQRLRAAYEMALSEEISVDLDLMNDSQDNSIDAFMNKVEALYNNFFERINEQNWIQLLNNDICFQIDTSNEIGDRLLKFFMDRYYLPTSIWVRLDEHFSWTSNYEELIRNYPKGFVNYLFANINGRFTLRYELFINQGDLDYDSFIRNYYDGDYYISTTNLYETNKCIENALKIIDYHEDILILKGRYLLKVDRVDEAIQIFNRIIETSDDKCPVYVYRAGALMRQGKIEEAYSDYKKSLELEPNSLVALKGVSDCAIGLGYYSEARDGYIKLSGIYSYNSEFQEILRSINNYLIDELLEKNDIGMQLARCYSKNGDYEKSYQIAKELEKASNDDVDLIVFVAHNLYYLNRLEEAYDYFMKLVKSDQADGDVYGGLATVCHDLLNKDEEALFYYNMAIEYGYALDIMHNNKASLLCRMGVYEQALEDCEESIMFNPGMAHAYKNKGEILCKLGRYEEALEACNTAIEIYPSLTEAYTNKANVYNRINKYLNALDVCNDAIESGISDSKLLYQKGRALYNLNRYDEALSTYEEAERDTEDKDLYMGIGHVWYVKKDYANAIRYYSKALDLEPEDGYLYFIRGKAYKFTKEYNSAIRDLNKAKELNPDRAETIYCELADVYFDKKEYKSAIEYYSKSEEVIGNNLNREDGYLFFTRGRAYRIIKEYNKAIGDFKKSIELAPEQSEGACANLVDIYFEQGLFEKSVEYCDKVIEFDSEYAPYFYRKAEALCKINRYQEAIASFNRAIEINNDNAVYLLQRGLALKKIGKRKEAKKDFKRVLQIDPTNVTAKKELRFNFVLWLWSFICILLVKAILYYVN